MTGKPRNWRRAGILLIFLMIGGLFLTATSNAGARPLAWGSGTAGIPGNPFGAGSSAPIMVPRLAGLHGLVVSDTNAAALRSDGEVVAWGMSADPEGPEYTGGPVRLGVTAVSVAAANGVAWAVQADGSVLKVPVDWNSTAVPAAGLADVTAVATGAFHFLALHTDGTVSTWGANAAGQLGDGTTTRRTVPRKVPGLTGVTAIAAGGNESLALMDDGTVKAWGQVPGATNGSFVTTAGTVPGLENITRISTTGGQVLALDNAGSVFSWGWNGYGQLCDGTRISRTTPARVTGLTPATSIAAGSDHSLILLTNGTVLACGDNRAGELGRPGPEWLADPTPVPGMTATTAIVAGSETSHAIQDDSAPVGTIRIEPNPGGDIYGTITGSGIYCGSGRSCAGTYPVGAIVTFTAESGRHDYLDSWTGICGGTGICTHTVAGDGTLTARFLMKRRARIAPDTRTLDRDIFRRIGKVRLWVKAWGPSARVIGTHLKCRLKRRSHRGTTGWRHFRRCDGWPAELRGLRTGRYTMVVRAANRFGRDRSPERIRFWIRRAARR